MSAHIDVETLSTYLDQQLSSRRQGLVEEHLDRCGECRERLADLRRVVGHLRDLERQAPPPHLGAHLHRLASLEASQQSLAERLEQGASRFKLQSNLAPIFAVVLALILIIYLLSWGIHRQSAGRIPVHLMPEAAPVEPLESAAARTVAERTFELSDGVWVEQGLAGRPVAVEIPSDDPRFVDWLLEVPERRALETLGTRVRLWLDGEVVEVRFDDG